MESEKPNRESEAKPYITGIQIASEIRKDFENVWISTDMGGWIPQEPWRWGDLKGTEYPQQVVMQ